MPNNLPKNMQLAVDFVTFASIIGHELMHYEDLVNKSQIYNMDSAALNELNAYKRSEKILEYFIGMAKAEADEVISIPGFYESIQKLEDYFVNMRKNYIKIVDAAEIFLNNENKICETLGLDKNKFKMLSFVPRIVFNAKNGGHIVNIESKFLDLPYRLLFEINIISGTIKLLNSPAEIAAFKKDAKKVSLIDKKSYTITEKMLF